MIKAHSDKKNEKRQNKFFGLFYGESLFNPFYETFCFLAKLGIFLC